MNIVRIAGWTVLWTLVFLWIIHHPTQASNDVHSIGHFINGLTEQ